MEGEQEMAETTTRPKGALRILVAEDNQVNRQMIMLMLESLNYSATEVENGLLALQEFDSNDYDLVLIDVQMPEMDGLELAREIRSRHPEGNWPRLVAVTAYAMPSDRKAAFAAGMDDFIAKPFGIADLVEVIDRAIEAVKAREAHED